ncbi:hypothetical protein K1T71_000991 [Dendrolimus kikuchii]|uniref:Uncharacterized protein n=1 Tax=Dendrolimus kikuchii TaxID=765133 RepID=A0ACC1DGH9_9NEOP|nr:hypothetical protein K1T71_000991 [Dendrolimus kikuchii]
MKKNKLKSRSAFDSRPEVHTHTEESSTSSSNRPTIAQEHARPRIKTPQDLTFFLPHTSSTSDVTTSVSNTSLSSSISRFRIDFEELKCKMRIFGESLNLCKCIADDFRNKLSFMERRLQNLERRHHIWRSESNYSAIIQKNKWLSSKTIGAAKVSRY